MVLFMNHENKNVIVFRLGSPLFESHLRARRAAFTSDTRLREEVRYK